VVVGSPFGLADIRFRRVRLLFQAIAFAFDHGALISLICPALLRSSICSDCCSVCLSVSFTVPTHVAFVCFSVLTERTPSHGLNGPSYGTRHSRLALRIVSREVGAVAARQRFLWVDGP
jgi:hypothetical protein